MLKSFRQFVSELAGGDKLHFQENDYRLATAALLVHAATIDGGVSAVEHAKLHAVVKRCFDLDDAAAALLVADATAAEQDAIDLYRFTSLLNRTLDEAGRQRIIEMMWQVVFADHQVTEFEDNLIWRAADLLGVSAQARIELRRRAAGDENR